MFKVQTPTRNLRTSDGDLWSDQLLPVFHLLVFSFPLSARIIVFYSIYVPWFILVGASGDNYHNTGN